VTEQNISGAASAAVRADVRERLRAVAAETLYYEDAYLMRVSRQVVEAASDWSPPIQVMFAEPDGGLIEMTIRAPGAS
jgi:hypothetical protein